MLGMTATPDRTDRKDIFELFDYNKVYEISLPEVIERGYLVPYTYYGLTDNIDYSKIRFQNNHYRVDDLERKLIVPERNEAVLAAYLAPDKGAGDKAIAFCVSIEHAQRMSEFFLARGVNAAAVYSGLPERDQIIAKFRRDELQVVFTVDLFNEGIDFPNVRVLLFLRPTESKTVFLQQLGRGLRLCAGKDRVRILDFIGNYNRANQIRKYLAKSSHVQFGQHDEGHRTKKVMYEYATGCEVVFDAQVEEVLNRQDAADLGIDKEDLKEAYFVLAEESQRKPTKADLDATKFPSRMYVQAWGTWRNFLQEVGEYTESSYHYPQGTHLGHILSLLWYFGLPSREGTAFEDRYIRMRGGLGDGRLGAYQRQLKYKLQAAMELGILEDDRTAPPGTEFFPTLTPLGKRLRAVLEPRLRNLDLAFPVDSDGVPGTRMADKESAYNEIFRRAASDPDAKAVIFKTLLGMHAVQQMLAFLYQIIRSSTVEKSRIYAEFFAAPFVQRYCEQEGIEQSSAEASKHRCPFLLNILAACDVLDIDNSTVTIRRFLLLPSLVKPHGREDEATTLHRFDAVQQAWPSNAQLVDSENLSIVRELFGADFLTPTFRYTELVLRRVGFAGCLS